MKEQENILYAKLDEFIRKYYRNQLIRGSLITLAFLSAGFLAADLLEFAFRFDTPGRIVLFYSWLLLFLILAGYLVLNPVLKLWSIGKRLTYEQAADIIGRHFPEIADKLLNTLQLMNRPYEQDRQTALLVAGIQQKIQHIRPFPFTHVINMRKNRKYFLYALIPLLCIVAGLLIAPSVISVPAGRIVQYNKDFPKVLPYSFKILNKNLEAVENESFELRVAFSGEEIPAEAFILSEGHTMKMTKGKGFTCSYTFRTVERNTDFRIVAGELVSPVFTIRALPKPVILSFTTTLDFPVYTGRTREILGNTGDLTIPEGTRVKWNIETKDAEQVNAAFNGEPVAARKETRTGFLLEKTIHETGTYSIRPVNEFFSKPDSLVFTIRVIPDAYPSIVADETTDSMPTSNLFFRGVIKDDYGFTRLMFCYDVRNRTDSIPERSGQIPLQFDPGKNSQMFFFGWEPDSLLQNTGQEIRYYFEVWDNDGIRGPKYTRSESRILRTMTQEEIRETIDENARSIGEEFQNSIREAESVEKNLRELNRKMVEKSTLNFQERNQLENILKSNDKILNTVEEIRKKNQENFENSAKYTPTGESILEKQKRLNELMDQLMTEEMKKLMKELRELMDKVDKSKLTQALEKLKKSQEDIEEQLDRNLQLFKQLEFDRKLEESVRNLRNLAEKQRELGARNQETMKPEEMEKQQQEIRQSYDSVRKEISELKEAEKELETPPGIGKTDRKQDSISNRLKQTEEMIREGKKEKTSQSQKNNAEQMDELAQELEQLNEEAEMEQMGEDAEQIRKILESLVRASFEQEDLIGKTAVTGRSDPKYLELLYRQKEMKDRLKAAEDSLTAIARRQFVLEPVISREIRGINDNLQAVTEALNARNSPLAQSKQQFAMTSINNLAVLLDESLKQMQMNMKSMMKGSCQRLCKNPSSAGGKQQIKGIKEMQQKMSQQMKQLKEGMEKEGKETGKKQAPGKGAFSEQVARMAAEQEAIRNELRKYKESLEEQGIRDGGNAANAIQEMEQNEKDLINKKIDQATMMRQEKILSRLLESEKAEMQRELEEKRESREQKEQIFRNFTGDYEYNKLKQGGEGILEYRSIPLNPYFKSRVENYMINIGR